ncbi:MAG: hypothetical protein ACM33T_00905 [Solirubrobacterales bacterium]
MRRALVLLCCLLLGACWQVKEPLVTQGVRAEGLEDGIYRRDDGTEVALRWNAAEGRYDIGTTGGSARIAPLGGGLWMVDYADAVRMVLLASVENGTVAFRAPTMEAETRLAKANGLALKPGPVRCLSGSPAAMKTFAAAVAALEGTPELVVADRLTRVR